MAISSADPPAASGTYWSTCSLCLCLLHAAHAHPVVLDDQIDQHADHGRMTTKTTHAALVGCHEHGGAPPCRQLVVCMYTPMAASPLWMQAKAQPARRGGAPNASALARPRRLGHLRDRGVPCIRTLACARHRVHVEPGGAGLRRPQRLICQSQRPVHRRRVPPLAEPRAMNLEALVLGLFSGVRPGTSLAAVLVLLDRAKPQRLLLIFTAAGFAFSWAIGLIVVGVLHGANVAVGGSTFTAVLDVAFGAAAALGSRPVYNGAGSNPRVGAARARRHQPRTRGSDATCATPPPATSSSPGSARIYPGSSTWRRSTQSPPNGLAPWTPPCRSRSTTPSGSWSPSRRSCWRWCAPGRPAPTSTRRRPGSVATSTRSSCGLARSRRLPHRQGDGAPAHLTALALASHERQPSAWWPRRRS